MDKFLNNDDAKVLLNFKEKIEKENKYINWFKKIKMRFKKRVKKFAMSFLIIIVPKYFKKLFNFFKI